MPGEWLLCSTLMSLSKVHSVRSGKQGMTGLACLPCWKRVEANGLRRAVLPGQRRQTGLPCRSNWAASLETPGTAWFLSGPDARAPLLAADNNSPFDLHAGDVQGTLARRGCKAVFPADERQQLD